jgi:hypothetical protein
MISLYDINNKSFVVEEFENSKIYIIDDFYKAPDLVQTKIFNQPSKLWKDWEKPSFNGKFFADVRHNFEDDSFEDVTKFLENICNQTSCNPKSIMTNVLKLYNHNFNDYKNCFWMPHKDLGYNGLIYLNQGNEHPGTNLYYDNNLPANTDNEHYKPWVSKKLWKLAKILYSKYNRMVLFDGAKFYHGAAFTDNRFFAETRINQVVFFQPNK